MKPDLSSHASFAILQCSECHRTLHAIEGDMLEFALSGWPRCCGETMTVVRPADAEGTDDER